MAEHFQTVRFSLEVSANVAQLLEEIE